MIDLIKNYVIGFLLLILAGTWVYAISLKKEVAADDVTIQDQRDKIGGFTKDLESTNSIVKSFSDKFKQLQADQDTRQKEVEDAMAKVDSIAKIHSTYSAKLLAETPKSENLCKEANDLIDSYIARGAQK
jgi:uncharacterized protein YlxW (UPF0749 family)